MQSLFLIQKLKEPFNYTNVQKLQKLFFYLIYTVLKPLTIHAIHIHEFGNLTKGCHSTGGHYNPLNQVHGFEYPRKHVGDLINNIRSDKSGTCEIIFHR